MLYDRKGAAIAGIKPGMVPWAKVFAGREVVSRHRHHAGPEPGGRRGDARGAAGRPRRRRARPASTSTTASSCGATAEAGRWMTEFMQFSDVLITTEEDIERVFGITGKDYEDVAAQAGEAFPAARSSPSRCARTRWSGRTPGPPSPTQKARSAGRGPTRWRSSIASAPATRFAAGLIHGLLDGDLQKGARLRRGRQRHQALDPRRLRLDHRAEVESMLKGGGLRISR